MFVLSLRSPWMLRVLFGSCLTTFRKKNVPTCNVKHCRLTIPRGVESSVNYCQTPKRAKNLNTQWRNLKSCHLL